MKTPLPEILTRHSSLNAVDFAAGTVLLVHKPQGLSSFAVVRQFRRLCQIRKVGHAGTLDPAASGLLILLTGPATRHQAEFMGQEKTYLATILLGVETDTWDLAGQVREQNTVPQISRTELEELIATRFHGEIDQVPPVFSALKRNGVPSYRLARRGESPKLEARRVFLYEAKLVDWSLPEFTLEIRCSSGFYVRSLAHDLGAAWGCGGTLKQLIRTRIGNSTLEEAWTLEDLRVLLGPGRQPA